MKDELKEWLTELDEELEYNMLGVHSTREIADKIRSMLS